MGFSVRITCMKATVYFEEADGKLWAKRKLVLAVVVDVND